MNLNFQNWKINLTNFEKSQIKNEKATHINKLHISMSANLCNTLESGLLDKDHLEQLHSLRSVHRALLGRLPLPDPAIRKRRVGVRSRRVRRKSGHSVEIDGFRTVQIVVWIFKVMVVGKVVEFRFQVVLTAKNDQFYGENEKSKNFRKAKFSKKIGLCLFGSLTNRQFQKILGLKKNKNWNKFKKKKGKKINKRIQFGKRENKTNFF